MCDRPEKLEEQGVEANHDPLYKINQFTKEWAERFTFDDPRMFDRYDAKQLVAVIVLRLAGIFEKYVAIFGAIGSDAGEMTQGDNYTPYALGLAGRGAPHQLADGCRHRHFRLPKADSSQDQEAVFIGYIEHMKDSERVVPSYVWLQPLDRFSSGLADCLFYSSESAFERMGIPADRESMVGCNASLSAVMARKFTDQNIQRCAQVVDTIACDERKRIGNRLMNPEPSEEFPIRMLLGEDTYGLRIIVKETLLGVDEIIKVLLGPINFVARGLRWIGHG